MVEHAIGNGEVSGSIPDIGSLAPLCCLGRYGRVGHINVILINMYVAKVAQLVEHRFRKARVPGSIPGFGS